MEVKKDVREEKAVPANFEQDKVYNTYYKEEHERKLHQEEAEAKKRAIEKEHEKELEKEERRLRKEHEHELKALEKDQNKEKEGGVVVHKLDEGKKKKAVVSRQESTYLEEKHREEKRDLAEEQNREIVELRQRHEHKVKKEK